VTVSLVLGIVATFTWGLWVHWAWSSWNQTEISEADYPKETSILSINLEGAKIQTITEEEDEFEVYFDHRSNGFRIKTEWVTPMSGLLVRDINGNGMIDNGHELFGDNTLMKNALKMDYGGRF